MRYAVVAGARARSEVEAYLPDNYAVLIELSGVDAGKLSLRPTFVIRGDDHMGWTLDGYVIPRLGSGNIGAREIDADDPLLEGIRYGWTNPICPACYRDLEPGRNPAQVIHDEREQCFRCGIATKDGIYYRADPTTAPYPSPKED